MKPFSPAAERNQQAILEVLEDVLSNAAAVLEVGSGTGQHAAHFARHMPHLSWQPTDLGENLEGIAAWVQEASLPNLAAPLKLDISGAWPRGSFDAIFAANVLQIVSWNNVKTLFEKTREVLPQEGLFIIYGPLNEGRKFTSEGNRALDAWARESFPGGGVKDLEAITALGQGSGMQMEPIYLMPANNRLLVFRVPG